MSKVIQALQDIENGSLVNEIKVNGEEFWPFFRSFIFVQLLEGILQVHKRTFRTPFLKLRNAFFGIHRWMHRFDVVILSNDMERKQLANLTIDKLVERFIEKKGHENVLYVELVKKSHLRSREYGQKRVASMDLVLLCAGVIKKITKPGYKARIENESIIQGILQSAKLQRNYREMLDTFLSKSQAFEFFLRRIRPKTVVITDYGYSWATYAARKLGINVIEFQHGVIGTAHPYYHPAKKLNRAFCPEHIFVFGELDRQALQHGNYVHQDNILPIGNYYISSLTQRPPNQKIIDIIKGYDKSVCIPTDSITHDYLISFVKSVAANLPEVIFLIAPRTPDLAQTASHLLRNIVVLTEFSFQEVVRHCNFNTSTTSTCCLEAIALGSQNILIDEDGQASQYYSEILKDPSITKFAKNRDEYILHINSMPNLSRMHIRMSAQYYMFNYEERLTMAMEKADA